MFSTFHIGGVPEHFNIPIRKAIDEGVFASKGLHLNWIDYKGGTGELVNALLEKKIDIGVLLTEGAVKAAVDKGEFKIVQVYINTPLVWGIYMSSQAQRTTLDDISSPTFLISRYGSGSHLMAYLLCQERNWDITKTRFIEMGNFQGALERFSQDPEALFLWERYMTKPWVDNKTLKKFGEIPTPWASFSLVVRNDVLKTSEAEVIMFLKTISDYTYKFKQTTDESIDYISSFFDFSVNDMKGWIQTTDWNYVLDRPQPKLKKAFDFLQEMKLIDSQANIEDICPSQGFWEQCGV